MRWRWDLIVCTVINLGLLFRLATHQPTGRTWVVGALAITGITIAALALWPARGRP